MIAIGRTKTTIKVLMTSERLEIKLLSKREMSKLNLCKILLKGVSSKYLLTDFIVESSI
jgi:hypothetical protein